MKTLYSAENHKSLINEKLASYGRQADGYRHSKRETAATRLMRRSSLAAIVPLTAAGVAAGQCLTRAPYGNVTLLPASNFVDVAVGPSNSAVARLRFRPSLQALTFETRTGPFGFIAAPGFASLPFAVNHTPSNTIGVPSQVSTYAILCSLGVGTYGDFCPGDFGIIGMQRTDDSRLGWIDLVVNSLDANHARVSIGARGFKVGPGGGTVHAGGCASLPVELTSFDAVFSDQDVVLNWETASELNNAGFELQRATEDETYSKVSFIEGQGTTSNSQTYRFRDDTVKPNTHYRYRLKQIDLDGTSSFSQIIEVFTEDPSQIALSEFYPNPANGRPAKLKINLADQAEAQVEVFDVRGSLVDSKTKMLNAGENLMSFPTNDLSAGTHFAKVQIGSKVLYRQFVVVK